MTPVIAILLFILIAWLLSSNHRSTNWRTVSMALTMQVSIGWLVLYVPEGKSVLLAVSDSISAMLKYSQAGMTFVFGDLATPEKGFYFAFQVLPVVVFFAALMSALYHIGLMGLIIRIIGGALQSTLGISRPESLLTASNIFVSMTEAPLAVLPFIPKMTRSQFFTLLVGGLATVAGSVMAGYAAIGIPLKYLIAASFMAAPGAIVMSKLMEPETEEPVEDLLHTDYDHSGYANILEAISAGASTGLKLALMIGAQLIAFIGIIALLNGIIEWTSVSLGLQSITLEKLFGILFQPIAFLLGVPWHEAGTVGSLIGQKIVFNEFVAFIRLAQDAGELGDLAFAISTFALCGFANFSSIAVLMGGIGVIAPERRGQIAKQGFRAMTAATLSNLTSAAIAGFFIGLQ